MKLNKILIMGLGLIGTAWVAFVALAADELAIQVKSIEDMGAVQLQVLYYDEDSERWNVEGNIYNVVAQEADYDHKRTFSPPNKIKVINPSNNNASWYCKDASGSEEIKDVPKVILEKISPNSCIFSYPVQSLTMNFYVYGLDNDTDTTFTVRQFEIGGGEIGSAKNYTYSNIWSTQEIQEMSEGYSYAKIEHSGQPCKFEDGTTEEINASEIHVKFNKAEGNNCVLSLEAFPPPAEYVPLKLNVNISGVDDLYTTSMVLSFTSTSSEGVILNAGLFAYDCERYQGCTCSDPEIKPVNGFCEETFYSTNLGNETIKLVWSRIKEDLILQKGVCKLEGSASMSQHDIVNYYDVYGSDPTQEVVCEIKPKQ